MINRLREGSIINECPNSVTREGRIHFVDDDTSLFSWTVCFELHSRVPEELCWEQFTLNNSLVAPEGCLCREDKEGVARLFASNS